MNKKTLYLIIGFAVILLGALLVLIWPGDDPAEQKFRELSEKPVEVRPIDMDVLRQLEMEDTGEGAQMRRGELSFEQIVALLRKKYDGKLDKASVRVEMLEELARYLQKKFPDDWVSMLQEILYAAFPDRAAELFQLSENLYKYEKELEDKRDELMAMDPEERQAYLQSIRDQYFGDTGNEIWAAANRSHTVNSSLRNLKNLEGDVKTKFESFQDTLTQTYGDDYQNVIANRRMEFVQGFMTAVQPDLANMKPEQRREVYKEVWRGMGLDEAAVGRLDNLEDVRDERWQNGATYMEERKAIVGSGNASDHEAALDALRQKYFGEEAETIKAEEAAGFLRFDRQRRYGMD